MSKVLQHVQSTCRGKGQMRCDNATTRLVFMRGVINYGVRNSLNYSPMRGQIKSHGSTWHSIARIATHRVVDDHDGEAIDLNVASFCSCNTRIGVSRVHRSHFILCYHNHQAKIY